MSGDRIRKISLLGLLVLAVAAFVYFGAIRRQARHEMTTGDVYYCPMHTTYHSDKPGNCPICSMKLVKLEGPSAAAAKPAAAAAAPAPTPSSVSQGTAIFV